MKRANIKIGKKFESLIWDDSRYTIITGGRGSGKSFSVNVYLLLKIFFEESEKILFTRKTLTSAHISIIPEFIEKIELLGLRNFFKINKTEIICLKTNSSIIFRGLQTSSGDNTANLKSIPGVTSWVLEEAEELTNELVFDTLDLSVRSILKPNKIIVILNPTTKEHFIYKRFFELNGVNGGFNGQKNNVNYIHTTYLDNLEHLNESFIASAERMRLTRPEKYNNIMLGGWLDKAEGVIYSNWRIGDYISNGADMYGQDYGFSIDPTTLVRASVFNSIRRIYLQECFYEKNLSTNRIYELNKRYAGQNLIVGDSAELRLISELNSLGNNVTEAEKGKGSVNAGIAYLQDFTLVIDPNSVNLTRELNNYAWHDRKNSTPIDAHNHLLDAVRYAVVGKTQLKNITSDDIFVS